MKAVDRPTRELTVDTQTPRSRFEARSRGVSIEMDASHRPRSAPLRRARLRSSRALRLDGVKQFSDEHAHRLVLREFVGPKTHKFGAIEPNSVANELRLIAQRAEESWRGEDHSGNSRCAINASVDPRRDLAGESSFEFLAVVTLSHGLSVRAVLIREALRARRTAAADRTDDIRSMMIVEIFPLADESRPFTERQSLGPFKGALERRRLPRVAHKDLDRCRLHLLHSIRGLGFA